MEKEEQAIKPLIDRIRNLSSSNSSSIEYYEAASLALSILYDTVGGNHPLASVIDNALKNKLWQESRAAANAVVILYDQGALKSPRLMIAHEIEGSLLDIAQEQAQAAEMNQNANHKQLQLAVAAFMAGAALEDSLCRLCDAQSIEYDTERTSISKLQSALYQPSKKVEIISKSENKQITVWGDTRNKADHAKFSEITQTEVSAMIIGIRSFIEKHLP